MTHEFDSAPLAAVCRACGATYEAAEPHDCPRAVREHGPDCAHECSTFPDGSEIVLHPPTIDTRDKHQRERQTLFERSTDGACFVTIGRPLEMRAAYDEARRRLADQQT